MRTVIILLLALSPLGACNSSKWHIGNVPFRANVTQGNVIEQSSLDALQPGMSKTQVLFIMGSPLIVDPFHLQRWDYVYTIAVGWDPKVERKVSLFFQGDQLVGVEGDLDPESGVALQKARDQDSAFNTELREVRQRQQF